MNNVYFMFHNGKGGNLPRRLLSLAIKLRTFGRFSHVECLMPDGYSYTSTLDGANGVTRRLIDYKEHPERWTAVKVPKTEREIAQIYHNFQYEIGKGYDLKAILFTELFKFGKQNDNKWYCSELCAYLHGAKKFRISPNKFYKLLMSEGYKTTEEVL